MNKSFKTIALAAALTIMAAAPACSGGNKGDEPSPLPDEPAATGPATFNVGSYNLRNDNSGDDASGNGWQKRFPAVRDIVGYHRFDIFGTQECKKNQLDALAHALPQYKYIGVGRDDGKMAGEYAAIFYDTRKFELVKEGNFWLSATPNQPGLGWDAGYPRVCTWGRFRHKGSGTEFYMFNLHMDHIGAQARRESPRLIKQQITGIAAGMPTIVTGDFNSNQNSEPYAAMVEGNMLNDSYLEAPLVFATNGTFNEFNPDRYSDERIDHVFITKGVKANRYGILTDSYHSQADRYRVVRMPSDHFPVLVNVTVGSDGVAGEPSAEVTVGTYNLHRDTDKDRADGNGWDERYATIARMLQYHGFDAVAVQEADDAALAKLAGAMPGYGVSRVGSDTSSAAVLYNKASLQLVDDGTADGLAYAKLRHAATGKDFVLASVQVTAGSESAAARVRDEAFRAAGSLPLVIAGDINANEKSKTWGAFTADGRLIDSHDAATVVYTPNGTLATGFTPTFYNEDREDHVFVPKGTAVSRYGILIDVYRSRKADGTKARTLSDHYPVAATITL